MKKSLIYLSISGVMAASLFLVLTGFFGDKNTPALKPNNLWVELEKAQTDQLKVQIPSLAPLVKRVEGAVLVVTTESIVKGTGQFPPGFERGPFGDFFRFFGPQGPGQYPNMPDRKARGQGSGFIIHPSGYALTNNHVIEDATSIKVKVGSELKEYDAEVVGRDEDTDVALIKIKSDRKDWPVIPLGSSTKTQVGDFAVAIGNPLGLELSVSSGIVSARGRREIHPSGRNGLFDFLQIDAPINPGNSGGPLLNLAGEAIGINTAMASAQGIAFTIPIDQVKQILPQLKENGKASRSWLGVRIEPVSSEVAQALGLPTTHGALVREVVPNSPASKAGLEPGDVISEFDGELIREPNSLQLKAGLAGAGKSVPLTVFRNGKSRTLKITLEELPRDGQRGKIKLPSGKEQTLGLDALGLSVVTLDETARKNLELDKNVQGARIVQVDPSSRAAAAGIEPNDVIFKVNDEFVKTAQQLAQIVEKAKKDSILRIFLKRERITFFVAIQKP